MEYSHCCADLLGKFNLQEVRVNLLFSLSTVHCKSQVGTDRFNFWTDETHAEMFAANLSEFSLTV